MERAGGFYWPGLFAFQPRSRRLFYLAAGSLARRRLALIRFFPLRVGRQRVAAPIYRAAWLPCIRTACRSTR